jgi:2-phospho-L-lactate guanylyltransferase
MSGADLAHVVAVVPVSSLSEAKSRLGEPLDPEERAALVLGLLRRTVMAARAAGRVAGVVVVSKDQALLAAGRAIGAATVAQGEGDLNAGLAAARASIGPAASAILVLPPDLPRVSAGEIDRLIEAGERAHSRAPAGPLVVLVPDQHGSGTNALLVSPPDEAAAAGATSLEVGGPLAFDVDTAEDLLAADLSGLGHEAGR